MYYIWNRVWNVFYKCINVDRRTCDKFEAKSVRNSVLMSTGPTHSQISRFLLRNTIDPHPLGEFPVSL